MEVAGQGPVTGSAVDLRSGHLDLESGVDEGLAVGVRQEEKEAEQGARAGQEGAWPEERTGSGEEAKPRGELVGEVAPWPAGRREPAERAKPEKRGPAEGAKSEEWVNPVKVGLLVGALPKETEVRVKEKEGALEEVKQEGREELAEEARPGTREEAKDM